MCVGGLPFLFFFFFPPFFFSSFKKKKRRCCCSDHRRCLGDSRRQVEARKDAVPGLPIAEGFSWSSSFLQKNLIRAIFHPHYPTNRLGIPFPGPGRCQGVPRDGSTARRGAAASEAAPARAWGMPGCGRKVFFFANTHRKTKSRRGRQQLQGEAHPRTPWVRRGSIPGGLIPVPLPVRRLCFITTILLMLSERWEDGDPPSPGDAPENLPHPSATLPRTSPAALCLARIGTGSCAGLVGTNPTGAWGGEILSVPRGRQPSPSSRSPSLAPLILIFYFFFYFFFFSARWHSPFHSR